MSNKHSNYRSEYSCDRNGKRKFHGGGGEYQTKTSRGFGKRNPDFPSPKKAVKK